MVVILIRYRPAEFAYFVWNLLVLYFCSCIIFSPRDSVSYCCL